MRWLGAVRAGAEISATVSHEDWLPSRVAAAGEPSVKKPLSRLGRAYQILQTFSAGLTRGAPGLHANASPNSGMFTTTPLIR